MGHTTQSLVEISFICTQFVHRGCGWFGGLSFWLLDFLFRFLFDSGVFGGVVSRKCFGNVISILSVAVWLAGDFAAGANYSSLFVPIWNGAIALMVYVVVVKTLVTLRKSQQELEARVQERTAALSSEIQERTRLEKEILEIAERSNEKLATTYTIILVNISRHRLCQPGAHRTVGNQVPV